MDTSASVAVWLHLITALLCLGLGGCVLLMPKGTQAHRLSGRIYVGLMICISVSALFIRDLNDGAFSLLHLLVPFTLGSLTYAIFAIRRYQRSHQIRDLNSHKYAMIWVYIGALVTAGSFTLLPGRLVHSLVFGVGL